jgi:RND family efflux transporter MFP subunit
MHWLTCACGICLLSLGCSQQAGQAAKPAEPPAKVAAIAQEDRLNTIQLTPEAEQRLGIALAPVQSRPMQRLRSYGGEVALPTGASIIVSAPLGGMLQAPSSSGSPRVGAVVAQKQPVFMLLPLLSPERSVLTPAERIRFAEARNTLAQSRIDADGQVQQAKVQVEAAQIALARAQRLLREKAGTLRTVDEAQAQLSLAQKGLAAAENRKRLVDGIKLDEEAGTLSPLPIESPRRGVIRTLQAAVGEFVAPGAPLFEVMDYDPVWIRVPVYAGELADIAGDEPARISSIAERAGEAVRMAQPVAAPPTAVPLASTVDMYYELSNPGGKLRPGERVSAQLALRGERESRVVPWSAVIHDIQGGQWVYENTGPHVFVRRRLMVDYVLDGQAVFHDGPRPGMQIVTAGAVELFGTEFGFAK